MSKTISENDTMLSMWNYEANREKGISTGLTIGSTTLASWDCKKCKSEYEKRICDFYTNINRKEEPCPFCSGKKVHKENSIEYLYKDIVDKYFDFERNANIGLYADELSKSSNIYIYVKGKENKVRVADFINSKFTLKSYSNEDATESYNFEVLFPEIAAEVDVEEYKKYYTKDKCIEVFGEEQGKIRYEEGYNPKKLLPYSGLNLPFRCRICDEIHWKSIAQRVGQKYGCNYMCVSLQTSVPEQIVYSYFKQYIDDLENKKIILKPNGTTKKDCFELDIYSKSLNIAIEYDGHYHRTGKGLLKDKKKNEYCDSLNIKLFRIIENKDENITSENNNFIYCKYESTYRYLNNPVDYICNRINEICVTREVACIDFKKFNAEDYDENIIEICKKYVEEDSLANNYPGLVQFIIPEERRKAYIYKKKSRVKLKCCCPNCGDKDKFSPKQLVDKRGRCNKCLMVVSNLKKEDSKMVRWNCPSKLDKSLLIKMPDIARFYSKKNTIKSNEIASQSHQIRLFNCPYPDCKATYEAQVKNQVTHRCICKVCRRKAIDFDGIVIRQLHNMETLQEV